MKRKFELLLLIIPVVLLAGLFAVSFLNSSKTDPRIDNLNKEGMAAYQKKDYQTAINDLEQVVGSNRDTKVRLVLAKCYLETKQYDAAKHHFNSAVTDEINKEKGKNQKIIDEANENIKVIDKITNKK